MCSTQTSSVRLCLVCDLFPKSPQRSSPSMPLQWNDTVTYNHRLVSHCPLTEEGSAKPVLNCKKNMQLCKVPLLGSFTISLTVHPFFSVMTFFRALSGLTLILRYVSNVSSRWVLRHLVSAGINHDAPLGINQELKPRLRGPNHWLQVPSVRAGSRFISPLFNQTCSPIGPFKGDTEFSLRSDSTAVASNSFICIVVIRR